jgi:hypothetical protein
MKAINLDLDIDRSLLASEPAINTYESQKTLNFIVIAESTIPNNTIYLD